MKPLYQILEIAKEFLAPNWAISNSYQTIFICHALENAMGTKKITSAEYNKGKKFVMQKIYPATTVFGFLFQKKLVSESASCRDEDYGVYRDAWLNKQIANLKAQIRKPKAKGLGFTVGDKVMVMRNGKEYQETTGFDNTWVEKMNLAIGRTYTVGSINPTGVSFVESALWDGFSDCEYKLTIFEYPPQVLKKV